MERPDQREKRLSIKKGGHGFKLEPHRHNREHRFHIGSGVFTMCTMFYVVQNRTFIEKNRESFAYICFDETGTSFLVLFLCIACGSAGKEILRLGVETL